jgi:hypothetical protein
VATAGWKPSAGSGSVKRESFSTVAMTDPEGTQAL